MSRTLYIFVDESGNPSFGDYYIVAGSWCVSQQSNPSRVLESTAGQLQTIAESMRHSSTPISELKGSQLPIGVLSEVIACLDKSPPYDDSSVEHRQLPWPISHPIRFTFHDLNPDLGIELLKEILGDSSGLSRGASDYPVTLQSLALASILNPIFQSGMIELAYIDQIDVILDADVWTTPAAQIEACIAVVSNPPSNLSFQTRDSEKTPGLQIADLAAYAWGRHLREGDCQESVALLDDLRLADK